MILKGALVDSHSSFVDPLWALADPRWDHVRPHSTLATCIMI